jgi:ATP-dependent Clp protease ATP-binding subunit ClpC
MFERYTEKARRVIFFSRYEASQFGSPYIEAEHLLLGLLREDKMFAARHLTPTQVEAIRHEIESRTVIREKVSTSVDLPLSNESKRILAYAAEESELAGHKHIGTEHLAAGMLREEGCFAAGLLRAHGMELKTIREEMKAGWLGDPAAIFGGEGAGIKRAGWTNAEFRCGEEKLGASVLALVPRVGEKVLLKTEGTDRRFRVVDVVYTFELPPHLNPEFPYLARGVIIQLENE